MESGILVTLTRCHRKLSNKLSWDCFFFSNYLSLYLDIFNFTNPVFITSNKNICIYAFIFSQNSFSTFFWFYMETIAVSLVNILNLVPYMSPHLNTSHYWPNLLRNLFFYVPCSNALTSFNNIFDPHKCLRDTHTLHTYSQLGKLKPQGKKILSSWDPWGHL